MLQDNGNKLLSDLLKYIGKKVGAILYSKTSAAIKKGTKSAVRAVENHKYSKTSLIRKNPKAGIYQMDGLTKDELKYIAKSLQKYRQDFAIEKNGNRFSVVSISANKQLIENLYKKMSTTPNKSNKTSLKNLLADAHQKAKILNSGIQKQVVKHKQVSSK